jgi:hypothetical protein
MFLMFVSGLELYGNDNCHWEIILYMHNTQCNPANPEILHLQSGGILLVGPIPNLNLDTIFDRTINWFKFFSLTIIVFEVSQINTSFSTAIQ